MRSAGAGYPLPWGRRHSLENNNCQYLEVKGILWQFYKLVLKVPSGRDENDGIGHFAELGSSWPGEAKTWPKIALRVGGRAEKYCVGGRAAGRYWAARPPTQYFFTAAARPSTQYFYSSARPPTHIRPSPNTQFSAHPPTHSAIFGHVLASPGQLEPSSAK